MSSFKKFYRYIDTVTLLALAVLLLLKLFVLQCSLLLCGTFVAVVVAWTVLSSHGTRMEDE